MSSSIFTKIIKREITGVFVYEDDEVVALMDKFPAMEGQVLVIPKKEIDSVFDIPDELYTKLWLTAKKVARAMDTALSPRRVCVVVEGFEVPHAHVRLYPVPEGAPLDIKGGPEMSNDKLERIAKKIRAAL